MRYLGSDDTKRKLCREADPCKSVYTDASFQKKKKVAFLPFDIHSAIWATLLSQNPSSV